MNPFFFSPTFLILLSLCYSMDPSTHLTMQVKMLNGQNCLITAIDKDDLDLSRYFIIHTRIVAAPPPLRPLPLQRYMHLLCPIAITTPKSRHPLLFLPRHSQLLPDGQEITKLNHQRGRTYHQLLRHSHRHQLRHPQIGTHLRARLTGVVVDLNMATVHRSTPKTGIVWNIEQLPTSILLWNRYDL